MASSEDTQPLKRTPRPRKAPAPQAEHHPKHAAPEPEPNDARIGQEVDPAAEFVSFSDGTEYRCEGGEITERVR
jgi:hypothetical protein